MLDKETEFEAFFKENYTRFYYFALQMVDDKEVCKDIVGDAFEQTWTMLHQTKQPNMSSYMYSLIRNKCVDYIRHETAKSRYADFCMHMYSENSEDESYDETELQIAQMYRMLEEFTPKTRQILEMCYFQKKKYSEVAEELNISISAVRKHIVNALKAFRQKISKKHQ